MNKLVGYVPPSLPLKIDVETKRVLKKLALARSALAELKGASSSVPNEGILLNTLSLQEAKDSSAIENIITTHDDLYRSDVVTSKFASLAAKEVYSYARALRDGYESVRVSGLITSNDILKIQATLEENQAGYRKLPGTALKNDQTGEVVFIPLQNHSEILHFISNLEEFINDDCVSDLDPLVKMAIIHHQFETIHPFYDGNGRTGRILNILYIVKSGLLDNPVLYLSRYVNQNKSDYYRLLQSVRDDGAWEDWVCWMLDGVEKTAEQTTRLVQAIRSLMQESKLKVRSNLPKIYSQDLLNSIFSHPYSKISSIQRDIRVSRLTATKYLDQLVEIDIMHKLKIGRDSYYVNKSLMELLVNAKDV